MKTKRNFFIAFSMFLAFISYRAGAEDMRRLVTLSGNWKFSIGDDLQWANPAYNDAGWDQIMVPDKWEDQGYDDYNGYAWYRKTFDMVVTPKNITLYLMLGRIDDADAVYLNGKLLGRSGNFPPDYVTAYNKTRKYIIPAGYLKENGNVIAVRVYDAYMEGGIVDGPIGLFYDEDVAFLNLNLTGRWKIHAGDNKDWKAADYDDNNWKRIQVPSEWENEVLPDYDGYAWYRVNFRVPQQFIKGDLYLSLGKVDDLDYVYLNGRYIGSVYDLSKDGEYRRTGWEYNARRIYKIPAGLLNQGQINTLAVRVYDGQGAGGIYEGPIGIMSSDNMKKYRNKHYTNKSFWDFIYDSFIGD